MVDSLNIKIGGKAGEGIKTAGLILAKSLVRLGFSIFVYDEYPSLIRGGHNTCQIYVSSDPVYSQHKAVDILIALDKQTLEKHADELQDTSLVLFDLDVFQLNGQPGNFMPIPWTKLAQGIDLLMVNMVSLGAVTALMGLSLDSLESVIKEVFAGKGKKVVKSNLQAIKIGRDYVKKNSNNLNSNNLNIQLTLPSKPKAQILCSANEVIGASAISSGLKYFGAYPMTPVSSLFHFLASNAVRYGFIVHHVENEIAAINTMIGASSAGVRVMTATSGGGFSLMVEGLGMMGGAEVPGVIILGMRSGPATGMPTWTGQGDLRFAVHAAQDEFPLLVLSPGNISEAFTLTRKAFILSEKYQLPVIILIDKYLGESYQSIPILGTHHTNDRFGFVKNIISSFNRYQVTDSGVSPRPFLGQVGGASTLANSYEHSQNSFSSEEREDRVTQMQKRLTKLESIKDDLWDLPVFGPKNTDTLLVGFGSTLGPILEALKELPDTGYLHFNYVWPFPESAQKILKSAKRIICLEGNAQGQLQGLIRELTGLEIKKSLRKFDGRPFYPEEIINYVKN